MNKVILPQEVSLVFLSAWKDCQSNLNLLGTYLYYHADSDWNSFLIQEKIEECVLAHSQFCILQDSISSILLQDETKRIQKVNLMEKETSVFPIQDNGKIIAQLPEHLIAIYLDIYSRNWVYQELRLYFKHLHEIVKEKGKEELFTKLEQRIEFLQKEKRHCKEQIQDKYDLRNTNFFVNFFSGNILSEEVTECKY